VSTFLLGLLGALVATNPPAAVSNFVLQTTGVSVSVPDPADPVEKEFHRIMELDDEAQAEVDHWIQENEQFAAKDAAVPPAQLRRRIQKRFEPIHKAYEDFIEQHPRHTRARVAYASFLSDTKDEEAAQEQLEKALEWDTNSPAVYNNLANIYGHIGPVKKAFDYYGRAIQLNPLESVYYHNLGTTVYLFRNDAMEHFQLNLTQVFAKALDLYSNAMRLDPDDFPLASDVAQTYYGIQPLRTDEALNAWTNALHIAHDEVEREGVYVHFARIKMLAGRFDEAHTHLNTITNDMYAQLKSRLTRNLVEKESAAKTNQVDKPSDKPSPP
jgi:tetratricopeptide (TPR) repeat protein